MSENWVGWFIIGCGIFGICGGLFQWEFFMNHRKAKFMIGLIGRTGSRVFYVVLGAGLTVAGVLIALGIVQNQS
jgi:hypothetical protein